MAVLDWWVKALDNPTLGQVTPVLIADRRDRLAEGQGPSDKPAAEATANRYLAVLSCAFTFNVKEVGWVASNPVRDVAHQREPQRRVRFLDEKERERLLAACQETRRFRG